VPAERFHTLEELQSHVPFEVMQEQGAHHDVVFSLVAGFEDVARKKIDVVDVRIFCGGLGESDRRFAFVPTVQRHRNPAQRRHFGQSQGHVAAAASQIEHAKRREPSPAHDVQELGPQSPRGQADGIHPAQAGKRLPMGQFIQSRLIHDFGSEEALMPHSRLAISMRTNVNEL
jgi:hypothetical protein